MVAEVRRGASLREVARRFGVSKSTVDRWVRRAQGKRLDRVDWSDHTPGSSAPANKTQPDVEESVVMIRRELKEISPLGEYGAEAIRREMIRRGFASVPALRTINRILERRGQFDGCGRRRRPAPPKGWDLPGVSEGHQEVDCFDIVEGLVIQGGLAVEVLNGISLHGGLVGSWPRAKITAKIVVNALLGHWRSFGLPAYVQFDNDTVFQGPRKKDSLGRVGRMALSLGVSVVYTPPREMGFQAAIENYNGRWQRSVWRRFHFGSRQELRCQSDKFVRASRRRAASRMDAGPARRAFPDAWELDYQRPLEGLLIFLRRTTEAGSVSLLGRSFAVSRSWPHRLVRA